jgi:hypothetical protein
LVGPPGKALNRFDTMPSRHIQHACSKSMVPCSPDGFYRTAEDLDATLNGRVVQAWLNGEVLMVGAMS